MESIERLKEIAKKLKEKKIKGVSEDIERQLKELQLI